MKRLLLAAGLLLVTGLARAVPIEGYTPTGKFKAVFVTEEGRLPVSITTTTLQHVFVDGGTVTVVQNGNWYVLATILPSTSTTLGHNCVPVNAATPTQLIATNADRKGALVCNEDLTLNLWVGDAATTNLNTPTTPPGACANLDEGTSIIYTGPLYAYTTAALTVCWYEKRP